MPFLCSLPFVDEVERPPLVQAIQALQEWLTADAGQQQDVGGLDRALRGLGRALRMAGLERRVLDPARWGSALEPGEAELLLLLEGAAALRLPHLPDWPLATPDSLRRAVPHIRPAALNLCRALRRQLCQPTLGLLQSWLTPGEIGEACGVPAEKQEALRKQLDRYRKTNDHGADERAAPGPRQGRYIYLVSAVWDIIERFRQP